MSSNINSGRGPEPLITHEGGKGLVPYTPKVPLPRRRRSIVPGAAYGASETPSTQDIDFAELGDGSLVELVEDPSNPLRTLLAVWREGKVEYLENLEHAGQILMPVPRTHEILRNLRLPHGVRPYESVQVLLRRIEDLISKCVVLSDTYMKVLASFVLSTWLIDRIPVAPYVSLVGLPQSGKTTLLKTLSLVCRRPLVTADITSAAFYEACARLTPTLLIDETGTHGSNRALRHLLRMGTTRDVVAMQRNRTFHAYGAKVICWLEPPDDMALNSRCILIPMTEANNHNLIKPTDASLLREAADLQAQLLQFRFDRVRTPQTVNSAGVEELRPRTRDLFYCLAVPSAEDRARCQLLVTFFKWQSQATKEPLSPPQAAVLAALFSVIHQRLDIELVMVGDLTKMVNELLERAGERIRLHARKIGAVLTSLGFTSRERTSCGWTVWLDRLAQERVHELVKTHGNDQFFCLNRPVPAQECPMCEDEVEVHGWPENQRTRGGTVHVSNNMGFVRKGSE